MNIRDVLSQDRPQVHSIEASESLAEALGLFAASKVRCLAVTSDSRLVGILSIRDVVARIDRHGTAALEHPVERAMTRDPVTAVPTMELAEAEKLFAEHSFSHLPVEDENGRLVGMVTPVDVLRRHLTEVQDGATFLRDYIAGLYY